MTPEFAPVSAAVLMTPEFTPLTTAFVAACPAAILLANPKLDISLLLVISYFRYKTSLKTLLLLF